MCVRAHQNAPETKPVVDKEGLTSAIYKLVCLLFLEILINIFLLLKE